MIKRLLTCNVHNALLFAE